MELQVNEEDTYKKLMKWTFEEMCDGIQAVARITPTNIAEVTPPDQLHLLPEIVALCEKSGWDFYEWQNENTVRTVAKLTPGEIEINELIHKQELENLRNELLRTMPVEEVDALFADAVNRGVL